MRFGTRLCRQVVGGPVGTSCAPRSQVCACFVMRGAL